MRTVSDTLVLVLGLLIGLFVVGPLLIALLVLPAVVLIGSSPVTGPWPILVGVVSLALLLGSAWLVARWLVGGRGDRALEELRLALARGEITEEEYERRRELLDRDVPE